MVRVGVVTGICSCTVTCEGSSRTGSCTRASRMPRRVPLRSLVTCRSRRSKPGRSHRAAEELCDNTAPVPASRTAAIARWQSLHGAPRSRRTVGVSSSRAPRSSWYSSWKRETSNSRACQPANTPCCCSPRVISAAQPIGTSEFRRTCARKRGCNCASARRFGGVGGSGEGKSYLRVTRPSARASAMAQPKAMTASPFSGRTVPTSSVAALPPALTARASRTSSGRPPALSRNLRSS